MIYLATPYSHSDVSVRNRRFRAVNRVAARLIAKGEMVFSPISHSHPICLAVGGLPGDFAYWSEFDRLMLSVCDKLIVYCQPGWDESVGVEAEMRIAESLGLEIEYLDP